MIKFIADAGSNHNGDLDRAVRLVEEAKRAGCTAVKFQMFDRNLSVDPYTAIELHKRALPFHFLSRLRGECDAQGIEFHMTPTSWPTLAHVIEFVHAVKIGSYEILCLDLINAAANTGKPLSISTGGATPREIDAAVRAARTGGCKHLTLYHCSPFYPALPEHCGLNALTILAAFQPEVIGWSDHTVKPGVINAAIGHGADIIEVHMDLDGLDGWESEHRHCWEASRLRRLIKNVRDGEEALQGSSANYAEMRLARTDPSDGRRPMKVAR